MVKKLLTSAILFFYTHPLFADETPIRENFNYVVNTLILLLCAALIMWMAAGFCMLESGLVRKKSTGVICLKNILIYSISCLCFYLMGYNVMFTNGESWLDSFHFFSNMNMEEFFLITQGKKDNLSEIVKKNYSSMAFIFFQMTFVATAASVISGALAERVKLWSFFIFVAFLSAFIYPIQGGWSWGGGWLADMGFSDFAGSTVVHSVGGWAALTGVFVLGPRRDKYKENYVKKYFPSSVPLVTLGVFILWFGWFGFNGGSLLITSGVDNISKMALIFVNTNIAACAGALTALLLGRILYRKINILLVLNGALAGLVSITAGPDFAQPLYAIFVGSTGSLLACLSIPILDKFKLDDVVGAIPVHLVAGIWGTLAVGLLGPASFTVQLIGVATVGAFVCTTSMVIWWILKQILGIRVSEDMEDIGQDLLELGLESDPDSQWEGLI